MRRACSLVSRCTTMRLRQASRSVGIYDPDEKLSLVSRGRFLHAGTRVRRPSSRRIDFHLHRSRSRGKAARPNPSLIAAPPTTARSTGERTGEQAYELKLSLGQLALVYK